MSDSNEPADGSGPDLQPQTPAENDQPQAAPEPSAPPAEAPDTPTPPAEQDAAPPAVDTPDAPPPADEQDTPTPPAEQDAAPPAVETPDTPPPADEEDSSPTPVEEQNASDQPDAPEDSPGDEAAKVEPPATQQPTADKPTAGSRAPQVSDRNSSADPRAPRRRPGRPPKGPSVVIRYGILGHLGQFRHNLQPPPTRGTNVVIRTDRGVELGEVVTVVSETEDTELGYVTPPQLEKHIMDNGPDFPFRRDGKILRLANPQDLIDQRHLTSSAEDERKFCVQEIKGLKLDMKLVAAEHLLGGERIIFYFLAEHRIDFRELVHTLANQYHTRIEMRQVGARDEARLVGDYERCGQQCCCKQFLKGLQPVSMRMAKTQKATLDPSKISGRCGRLMCCLRYEDQCYRDLKKCLPHKNIWVKTCDQIGRVTGTQILTQLVQVQLPDGSRAAFPNEDIIERNVDPPQAPPTPAPTAPRPSARRGDRDRKPQASAPSARRAEPAEKEQATKPQPALQPAPAPTPEPQLQPRASAEVLDPAWAGLLGESIVEDTSAAPQDPQTVPPAEEPQASPESHTTAEATPLTTPPASEPAQSESPSPADKSAGAPAETGDPRKKRRRRRGKRANRKPNN